MNSIRILFQRSLSLQSKAQICIRMPFYAVQLGKKPGVYKTWSECQEQTTGFKGARFKKFEVEDEALAFATAAGSGASKTASKEKASANKEAKKRTREKDEKDDEDSDPECKVAKEDPDAVTVYTDGCCISNGKKNPCGGIGVYWGPDHPNNLSEKLEGRQTNNRAEIYAAIRAVQQAKESGIKKLIIKTDSAFLINCQTNWVKKWKKNGWKTSAGADVTNKEELVELDEVEKDFDVTYIHVPGHQGVEGNEAADKLAKAGSRK